MGVVIGPRRWWRGYKVHKLCERWRQAFKALYDSGQIPERVWLKTDEELMLELLEMVRKENPDATADELAAGTLWTLEASAVAAEKRLEEAASGS